MNTTQREQAIMMLMPTAVIALLYGLLMNFSGHQQQYKEQLRELAAIEPAAKTENDVPIAKTSLQMAQEHRDIVARQLETRRGELQAMCKSFGDPNNQFRVLESFSRLLKEHQIMLLSQTLVQPPKLSPIKQRVLETIDQHNSDAAPQYRQLELRGRYGDVLAFLQRLAALEQTVLPVSLQLKASDQADRLHAWNLVVVM